MSRSKRPPLLQRTEASRGGPRQSVVIPGRCQVGERAIEDVLITDLGADGCRLRGSSVGVTKVEPIRLWLGELGPLAARLKWLKKGSLGLAFETPLEDAVLDRLLESTSPASASNVVPLRRRPI